MPFCISLMIALPPAWIHKCLKDFLRLGMYGFHLRLMNLHPMRLSKKWSCSEMDNTR